MDYADTTINAASVIALREVGLDNVVDLIKQTRSQICSIPGMTTREVFQLEKALAARHLYLQAENMPHWNG
ncbi:MAG: hypothetical protein IJH04_03360 [Eggerthellaceae bacterium]|nr:hypothetical protein [Eggerthellaceae bacterium]